MKHTCRNDSVKIICYGERCVIIKLEYLGITRGRVSIVEFHARRIIQIIFCDRNIFIHGQRDLYDVAVPEGKRRVVVQRFVLLDAVFSPGVFIGNIRALNSQRKYKFFGFRRKLGR